MGSAVSLPGFLSQYHSTYGNPKHNILGIKVIVVSISSVCQYCFQARLFLIGLTS